MRYPEVELEIKRMYQAWVLDTKSEIQPGLRTGWYNFAVCYIIADRLHLHLLNFFYPLLPTLLVLRCDKRNEIGIFRVSGWEAVNDVTRTSFLFLHVEEPFM
jgi:hypothetical protein